MMIPIKKYNGKWINNRDEVTWLLVEEGYHIVVYEDKKSYIEINTLAEFTRLCRILYDFNFVLEGLDGKLRETIILNKYYGRE